MKVVQPRRFVLGIKGSNKGVAGGFDGTVGDSEEEGAEIQAPEIPGENGEDDGSEMADESDHGDPLHPKDITERAAEDHGEGEAPEGGSGDPAHLFVGEAELGGPDGHCTAAQGEAHGSDNEGQAAGKEELGRGVFHGAEGKSGQGRLSLSMMLSTSYTHPPQDPPLAF